MGRDGWCTVSAGTIDLKVKIDPSPMRRALAGVEHSLGRVRINSIAHLLSNRERAQREYAIGQRVARDFPDLWECFCVTTNEGRCRVISRPRGGWA